MKMMLLACLIPTLWTGPALAGDEGAAGGDGVRIENNLYLLDFVEAGIEEQPYIDDTLKDTAAFDKVRPRVAAALERLADDSMVDAVAAKMVEVGYNFSPLAAYALLNTLERYTWVKVLPQLLPVNDEDSPLDLGLELVQLAVRKQFQIYINRSLWDELPVSHRAGLIFHELLYALTAPIATVESSSFARQPSIKARQFVGKIFGDRRWASRTAPSAQAALSDLLGAVISLTDLGKFASEADGNGNRLVTEGQLELTFLRADWLMWSPHQDDAVDPRLACGSPPWEEVDPSDSLIIRSVHNGFSLSAATFKKASGEEVAYTKFEPLFLRMPNMEPASTDAVSSEVKCLAAYADAMDDMNATWRLFPSAFAN